MESNSPPRRKPRRHPTNAICDSPGTALLTAAALGAIALGTKPANATFYVFYSTNGGANYTAVNPGGSTDGQTIGSFNFSSGGISIGTSSFSNDAPNTAGAVPSYTNNGQLSVQSSNAASIEFAIVDNGFQGPTTQPLSLSNGITFVQNGNISGSTLSQFSCVNNNATVPTTTNVNTLCTGSPNLSPTASLTTGSMAGTTGSQTTTTSVGALNAPFSIGEFLTLNLQAGANVNVQGNATLTSTPVATIPEPVSLSLLAVGLIGVGAARMRRKA